jgi:hypothetical protein
MIFSFCDCGDMLGRGGILLGLVLGIMSTEPADASLVPVDLLSAGDSLITEDTTTGIQWLDLTVTNGVSYDAVVAGAGGWANLGFRVATQTQVDSLYRHAGIDARPSFPGGTAVSDLLGLMGCTRGCATSQSGSGATGLVDLEPFDPNAALKMFVDTFPDPQDPTKLVGSGSLIGGDVSGFLFRKEAAVPGIGIYLFRVPEPSILYLFGAGILCLFALRMKRT